MTGDTENAGAHTGVETGPVAHRGQAPAVPTTRATMARLPMEPENRRSPTAKTPPSVTANQYPFAIPDASHGDDRSTEGDAPGRPGGTGPSEATIPPPAISDA